MTPPSGDTQGVVDARETATVPVMPLAGSDPIGWAVAREDEPIAVDIRTDGRPQDVSDVLTTEVMTAGVLTAGVLTAGVTARPETAPEEERAPTPERASRRFVPDPPLSMTGLVLAVLGYASALTPTLVPRTTTVQVVATALACATGYAVGAVLGAFARLVRSTWASRASRRRPARLAVGATPPFPGSATPDTATHAHAAPAVLALAEAAPEQIPPSPMPAPPLVRTPAESDDAVREAVRGEVAAWQARPLLVAQSMPRGNGRLPGRPRGGRRAPALRRRERALALVVAAAALAVLAVFGATRRAMEWQLDQATAAGWPIPSWGYVATLGPLLALLLIVAARVVRAIARRLGHLIGRAIPHPRLAAALGAVLVSGVVPASIFGGAQWADQHFGAMDASLIGQENAPEVTTRTGSASSTLPWDSLGRKGREFVLGGPRAADISRFTGRPAKEPIRVYVGMDQADGPDGRAAAAVEELHRSGALERERLVVIITSGLGAVHPVAADVAEYLADGDIATVATEYSLLPSWLTVLRNPEAAEAEARALLPAVVAAVNERPPGQRPQLYLYAESLGAFGSQVALADSSPAEVLDLFDGVLWVGSPAASPLRRQWPTGGPSWEPTVQDGSTVRFSADPERLRFAAADWGPQRILFLQAPTDPVAYLDASLARERPPWLDGQRGPLVPRHMTWWPLLSAQQLLMDLTTNGIVPPGIGHNYSHFHAVGWAAIMQPDGWTREDVERLNEYRRAVAGTTSVGVGCSC